jgi:hypothetical protein
MPTTFGSRSKKVHAERRRKRATAFLRDLRVSA